MKHLYTDDRGVAMIMAVMISVAVVLLSVVAVTFSVHDSTESAEGRERVRAVAAAEAGVHFAYSHLENADEATVNCRITESLGGTIPAGFDVTITYYDSTGTPLTCTPGSGVAPSVPATALIESLGSTGDNPTRKMQSLVALDPVPGGTFGPWAIFSDQRILLNSNVSLFGSSGNDADLYTNGNITLDSNTVIYGDMIGQGTVTMDSNAEVKQDVWSKLSMSMATNTIVRGSVKSSTGSITLSGKARIFGDATASGAITMSGRAKIDGTSSPNTPTAPPPVQSFPAYTYDPADWTAEGYSVHNFTDCLTAHTYIGELSSGALPAGDRVIRIASTCDLAWNNSSVKIRGDLAIVHDGSVSFDTNSEFEPVNGPHELFFVVGRSGTGSTCDFTMSSNSRIAAGLPTFVHTPCRLRLNSNSSIAEGQLIAGEATFDSNSGIQSFTAATVPGAGNEGWEVEVSYVREVTS